jgi:hypothetical protein
MEFRRTIVLVLAAIAVIMVIMGIIGAWLALRKPPTTDATDRAIVARERPEKASPSAASDADTRRITRADWEERRTRIRAAHAPRARDAARGSASPSSRACAEAECSSDAAASPNDAVFSAFIEETTTLTQGCEELIEGKPTSVRIQARLIGAPDIGTVVESLDVSGPAEHVDALTECLMEGMYALDLGTAETSFARDAVLMHGLLDEVAGEGWLTAERVAEIRQQMLDGGLDPGKDPMVMVDAEEPSPEP